MYINRHIEATLKKVSEMYPTIILAVPRQVGKTTLIKRLYRNKDMNEIDLIIDVAGKLYPILCVVLILSRLFQKF